jgi:ABC-2 type transport system ATP-binding protein
MLSAMLRVEGLRKRYGARVAVDGVSFEVAPGEIYGLLGPNGAGKTTTISMIAGVLPRDGGAVAVDGIDLDRGPPARARLGLVTQGVTLYPDLSGRENLRFWGRLYGLAGDALARAVEGGLDAVALRERGDEPVGAYSGGMQRRLNLAAGLLHEPSVLILDEPTVGVDPQSRAAIFDLLERRRDEGAAVLYTTHYMEEAERLCGRIGIMDGGRIVAEGTRRELVARLGRELRLELAFAAAERATEAAERLAALAGTLRTACDGGVLRAFVDDARRLPALLAALLEGGLEPTALEVRAPDLEDVFLELTGRGLRD